MTTVFAYEMPSINMVLTGKNIFNLRNKAGYSVANLQSVFGFSSPQAIYKWQRGDCLPSIDNLVILSIVFHTSIDAILVLDRDQDFFLLFSLFKFAY